MTAQLKPRIRQTPQNTQFTYNLSKRIHDVKTYPVLSPQGATILIYGHDNGFTIAWRGGRRFKPVKPTPAATKPSKQNGTNADVIMLDSDDEDAPPPKANAPAPFVDKPEFETLPDDDACPTIVQTLELSLGAAVHHIAVLPITPCASDDADTVSGGAGLLKEKMLFAVSTTAADIFLVSLPLTPPSPQSKGRPELRSAGLAAAMAGSGYWGESVTQLVGQTRHSEGVALTLYNPATNAPPPSVDGAKGQQQLATQVVVAAHNGEASGVLRLWSVPLPADSTSATKATGRARPFQTEYLPAPLNTISFNPTNASQLLIVAASQAVRVYDYVTASVQLDDGPDEHVPFPPKGSWLLSLYQPFSRPSASRKPILDAGWISRGKAVFVLMADATWGIWDVEGASPLGSTLLGRQGSGIEGGALTLFSASGHVEGTGPLRAAAAGSRPSGDFVPMTPHTRRDATASLGNTTNPERLAAARGGIVVAPLPSDGDAGPGDESIVLWIGGLDNVCVIPAVARFWDAQLRKGSGGGVNLFSGTTPTRMIRLQDLSTGLLGERCCGVGAAVNFAKLRSEDGGLRIEVLVRGESRLVIVHESEEGPGTKVGGIVSTRRRLFSERRGKVEPSSAITVQTRPDQPRNVSFNLTVNKNRTGQGRMLTDRSSLPPENQEDPTHDFTLAIGQSKSGFGFADLEAAADQQDDSVGGERDIEAEMLDIMEIDQALDDMEEDRDSGRKKVFFEGI